MPHFLQPCSLSFSYLCHFLFLTTCQNPKCEKNICCTSVKGPGYAWCFNNICLVFRMTCSIYLYVSVFFFYYFFIFHFLTKEWMINSELKLYHKCILDGGGVIRMYKSITKLVRNIFRTYVFH